MIAKQALRVITVSRLDYLITKILKNSHRNVPHTNIVFQYEDRFRSGRQIFADRLFVSRRWRGGNFLKKNLHGCSFIHFAFNTNLPATLTDNSVTGGETEAAAGSFVLGREKWFEEMGFHLIAHADPRIDHADHDIIARSNLFQSRQRLSIFAQTGDGSCERQTATVTHGVSG